MSELRGNEPDPQGLEILDGPEPLPLPATAATAEPGADPPRQRRRMVFAVGAVTLLVIAAGGIYASSSNAAAGYRLAAASSDDVTQAISATGTVAPVSQASVVFPTSGTVAAVYVSVGQKIKAGKKLAKLDTQQLRNSVTAAEKTLADAQLNLTRVENGETTSGATGGSGGSVQTRAVSTPPKKPSPSGGGDVAKLLQEVTMTQKAIDSAAAAAKLSLAAATAACRAQAQPQSSPSASGTPGNSSAQPSQAPLSNRAETDDQCAAAQQKAAQDQAQLTSLQSQQVEQMAALNAALQAAASQTSSPAPAPSPTSQEPVTTTPTAEQITSAQSQVNAAEAGLAEAQQNLRAATIVSPISGTVISVPYAKGDQASATDAIVIAGSTQYQATVQISVEKISSIAVGQSATVQPSGSTTAIEAKVTTVGAAPVSTDSAVTYPVTLTLAGQHSDLRSGASANVAIITASATDVLTVPTSSVHALSTIRTVTMWRDDQAQTVTVTVGAVGPERTEILSGLEFGDQVVLADLEEEMPTANTSTTRGFGGGGFGGGGGGFGGGGGGFRPPG